MSSAATTPHTYRRPTLVVGLGDFGASCVEQLAADWRVDRDAGAGVALSNLRLMHVHSDEPSDAKWREREQDVARLALHLGEGELPHQVLEFVTLRAMGLIRVHDGRYEIGRPVDRGVEGELRVRTFRWRPLAVDPVTAVHRMAQVRLHDDALASFLDPLLARFMMGHMPRVLRAMLGRLAALDEGRDPSPWEWLTRDGECADHEAADWARVRVDRRSNVIRRIDESRPAEVFAELKSELQGLEAATRVEMFLDQGTLEQSREQSVSRAQQEAWHTERSTRDVLWVSRCHRRRTTDPTIGMPTRSFLTVQVDQPGWAHRQREERFWVHPLSDLALGLYDDFGGANRLSADGLERLSVRLGVLGQLLRQGLARLWVDLQRSPGFDSAHLFGAAEEIQERLDAICESLDMLARTVIDPLRDQSPSTDEPSWAEKGVLPHDPHIDGPPLTARVDPGLARLPVTHLDGGASDIELLERRLAETLGVSTAQGPSVRQLVMELGLTDEDVDPVKIDQPRPSWQGLGAAHGNTVSKETPRLVKLRRALAEELRSFYARQHLQDTWSGFRRTPPPLTILVVGDMKEAFTRQAIRTVMREISSEVHRVLRPLFESKSSGVVPQVALVPVMWMPHHGDAVVGEDPQIGLRRMQEAVSLEALHCLSAWVRSSVRHSRVCRQIVVNGRVTDNGIVGHWDAVRQSRDLVRMFCRADIRRDHVLAQLLDTAQSGSYFASVMLAALEFPGLRAREYLANRGARDVYSRVRGRADVIGETPEHLVEPLVRVAETTSPLEIVEAWGEGQHAVVVPTDQLADHITQDVVDAEQSLSVQECPEQLRGLCSDEREAARRGEVHRLLGRLAEPRGAMEQSFEKIRRNGFLASARRVQRLEILVDRLVQKELVSWGLDWMRALLKEVQAAHTRQLEGHDGSTDGARSGERWRRSAEHKALETPLPKLNVSVEREDVEARIAAMPRWPPILAGVYFTVLAAFMLGAPLLWFVSIGLDLDHTGGVSEFVLGPMGRPIGALLLGTLCFGALHAFASHRLEELRAALNEYAEAWRGHVVQEDALSVRRTLLQRLEFFAASLDTQARDALLSATRMDAERIDQMAMALDLNLARLWTRAELLNVRPNPARSEDGQQKDDVRRLFDDTVPYPPRPVASPISGEVLQYRYERDHAHEKRIAERARTLIAESGLLPRWREDLLLGDIQTALAQTRSEFDYIRIQPLHQYPQFRDDMARRLREFVVTAYPTTGHGADFDGREGLDPSGLKRLFDGELLLHRAIAADLRDGDTGYEAGTGFERDGILGPVRMAESEHLPLHDSYLLSATVGIADTTIRNMHRYVGPYDVREPSPYVLYPFSMEGDRRAPHRPLTHLDLRATVRHPAPISEQPSEPLLPQAQDDAGASVGEE